MPRPDNVPVDWTEYRAPFAPHAVGAYEARRWDDENDPVPQRIALWCEACGGRQDVTCATGQVRNAICRWGRAHLHRDPLAAPRVRQSVPPKLPPTTIVRRG